MSKPDYQTTRIWTRTLKKLRLIAALTGERIVQILDRLAEQELARVKGEVDATEHLGSEEHAREEQP
jgi:hypothetical protein